MNEDSSRLLYDINKWLQLKDEALCSLDNTSIVRPSWDEYFIMICELVSLRSTCLRRRVGAIVVKNRRILATGYNGAPSGVSHADRAGCIRAKYKIPSGERHELCRGLHAEQNAIIQAAHHGVSIAGADMYCTTKPCVVCAKMCINAGIKRILYRHHYDDPLADELLAEAGVEMIILP